MVPTFADAVAIARGCHQYSGGHFDDVSARAYTHGIDTVLAALEGAESQGLTCRQVSMLREIGTRDLRAALAAWDFAVATFRRCQGDWRVNRTYWVAAAHLRRLGFPAGPAGVGSGL